MATHLRLIPPFVEDAMTDQTDPKPRVYPPAVTCFQCRTRFTGDDAKPIVDNDGACNACCEYLDAFTRRSDQGNPDNTEFEWQEPKKCSAGSKER